MKAVRLQQIPPALKMSEGVQLDDRLERQHAGRIAESPVIATAGSINHNHTHFHDVTFYMF